MEASPVERRIVTVLFADIVGFTTLSERLDPEDVATVQEAYFAAVREIVSRYGGRVEKFIGDAAMAVFGLPQARDDDAERAVRAGLALVASVEHLGARLGLEAMPLQLRVGINTGEVISSEPALGEWRVTGDTVNTAARLQTASLPGRVLVGEVTALTIEDVVALEPAISFELKGKADPVRGRMVAGLHPDRSRERAMGRMRARTLGRDPELATLRDAVHGLAPPRRTARWLVVAPPGVGKSRLLAELAAELAGSVCVLRTQLRAEVDDPFASIAELAHDALASDAHGAVVRVATTLPELRRRLREGGASASRARVLADELFGLLESGGATSADSASGRPGAPVERSQRFAAWIEAFDLLACDRLAVWFLEDLHWAGPDLLAFVDQVHRSPAPHGRIVIGTARPALLEREPAWCGARADEAIHRLDLGPLPARSARELVVELVGDACLPDTLVERIAAASDGNPLFIEELLRTWLSVGILAEGPPGTCRLVDPTRAVDLPSTVQAIYAGQLDDLPPEARLLARRASVAGRAFPVDALPALEAPAGDALERLRVRRLLDGPSPGDLGPSYAYRHVLLRDAGYATLARLERARLHARLAGWMIVAAGDRGDRLAEPIARQYEAALEQLPALIAGDPELERTALAETAAAWLERAGAVALRTSAQETARDLLRRSLDRTPEPTADRARRLVLLGEATAYSGHMDAGAAAYREAARIYRAVLEAGDPSGRSVARDGYASAVLAEGTVLVQQLRFGEAERLADEGLDVLQGLDDLATARLRYLRAWAQIAYQPRAEAAEDVQAVLAVADRNGDQLLRLEALSLLQGLRAETGDTSWEELLAQSAAIVRLALEVGSTRRAIVALRARGLSVAEIHPGSGVADITRSIELANAHGFLEDRAWGAYALAEIELVRGDWRSGIRSAEMAFGIGEANAYHRAVVRTCMVLTPMALGLGRIDLLVRCKDWLDSRRDGLPASPFARFTHAAMDLQYARAGLLDPFVPGDDLLEAWEEAPGLPSWQACTWINVGAWIHAGRLEVASDALDRMGRWLDHPLATPLAGAVAAALGARLDLARSAFGAALVNADRALALASGIPAPWASALAHRVRAAALTGLRRADEAAEAIRMAETMERSLAGRAGEDGS